VEDSNVMESARAMKRSAMANALEDMTSVRMNAFIKDKESMERGSVLKMECLSVFQRDLLAMESVMLECSNVEADAILIIIPATDTENAMERAFPDTGNAMVHARQDTLLVENTVAGTFCRKHYFIPTHTN
jgi:hypothetical protein